MKRGNQSNPKQVKRARISSQLIEKDDGPRASTKASQGPIQSVLKRPKSKEVIEGQDDERKNDNNNKVQNPKPEQPNKQKIGKSNNSNKTKEKTEKPIPKPNQINIVFGTYEHILYGIQLNFSNQPSRKESKPTLSPLFHFVAHRTPLNVLAISPFPSNPTLVSSSTDSPLTLWSISRKKCLGTLSCGVLGLDSGGAAKEPGVRIAKFDNSSKVLVVGDENGGLTIYRTRDWALVKKMNSSTTSNNSRINDLAIEPRKGRLMLSVGKDRCLRMWDLSNSSHQKSSNKPMASMRLGTEAEKVSWSPTGRKIGVITNTIATVYDTTMNPLFSFTSPKGRVHDAKFFLSPENQEFLILGCEDSICRIFLLKESSSTSKTDSGDDDNDDQIKPECVIELIGHSNRVKSVEVVKLNNELYAITISSDGFCHIYRLDFSHCSSKAVSESLKSIEIEPMTKYDTGGCRLTCLAAEIGSGRNSNLSKQALAEGEDQDENDGSSEEEEEESVSEEDQEGSDDDDRSRSEKSMTKVNGGKDLDGNGKPIIVNGSSSESASDGIKTDSN